MRIFFFIFDALRVILVYIELISISTVEDFEEASNSVAEGAILKTK